MRALVATGVPWQVQLQTAAEPTLADGEALIEVHALSVNRGELHRLEHAPPGWRPGWDFAGIVLDHRGTDPSAPSHGTRVLGTVPEGAWAERIAVPLAYVAELPDRLSFEQGAALPVAGVTAHRVLGLWPVVNEMAPSLHLWGTRVLITGAAGGVGRLAVQLARRSGAVVTAVVGAPQRIGGLVELGAQDVVVGIDDAEGPFDMVLESVGGSSLSRALTLTTPRGLVVTFGNSSRSDTTFSVADFYPSEAMLRGYHFWSDLERRPPAPDLTMLAELAAAGDLRVDIGATLPWDDAAEALARLRQRTITGKAVLTLDAVR